MNKCGKPHSLKRINYIVLGIAFGVLLSLLFALLINPGLMGVGIAIGVTIGLVLSEQEAGGKSQ